MASTNQSPFYQRAEQEFHEASNDEERIQCLEIMIKECPKHKSSENMLKNLTLRLKRLKNNVQKQKKSGKGGKAGIKKAEMQAVIAGFPNTGKSTLFKKLTGLDQKISIHPFTTFTPRMGTIPFENTKIQLIDTPPFPNHDKGLINGADTILLLVDDLAQIQLAQKYIYRSPAKIILIYNKEDLLDESGKRKILATLASKYKKYSSVVLTAKNLSEVKRKELVKTIFKTFPIIRVYTKEPKKKASPQPMILKIDTTIAQAADKILKGMAKKIKRIKIWGPSSKFGGQSVGLEHKLKDKDVIEFQTT